MDEARDRPDIAPKDVRLPFGAERGRRFAELSTVTLGWIARRCQIPYYRELAQLELRRRQEVARAS